MHQESISILSVCAHETSASYHMKQKHVELPLREINRSSIFVRLRRQKKISKHMKTWRTLQPNCLVDIYKTFYLTTAECTFFSSSHRIFTNINHMWAIKQALVNLNGFNSYNICCFITRKWNLKSVTERYLESPNNWKWKSILLNNQQNQSKEE